MTNLWRLCILATLSVLRPHVQVSGNICRGSNRTDTVAFASVLNEAEYVRYGMSKAMHCCASGFHSIQWNILNASEAWEPYPPESRGTDTPKTEEDGQVLRIFHATDFQNTKFRCDLIVNESVVLSHNISLHVSHCSTRARGPLLIEPFPQNQTIYDYGDNISLYCTGDFGCYNHNDVQIVTWSVDTDDNTASDVSSRYHLVTNESEDKTTLGVTLNIEKVEQIDTTRTFICTIMNDQSDQGQTSRRVWIIKKDGPSSPTIKIVVAVSIVVGIFVTLLLVGLCMYRCYGPQVKLFVYVHCPCCHRKAMDEDKYNYHVFLYHSDDDGEKADYIRQNLKERNYNVFISSDITPGTETINTTSALLEKSAAVHFLYTENLLHDQWALRFLINLIEDGKDILCLEIDDFEPQKVIAAIKDAQCGNRKHISEVSSDGVNTDGENVDRHERVSKGNDIGYWKRLPKVKVPTENDSKRKQDNFWSFIQNRLPKPRPYSTDKAKHNQRPIDAKERISSASSSLLENELPIAMCYIGPQPEFSPNTDSVFEYPLENAHSANNNYDLNVETCIDINVQQLNPQPVKLYEMVLGHVNGHAGDNGVTTVNGSQNAFDMENKHCTIAADNRKHANVAENLRILDQNLSNHYNSFHGVTSHVGAVDLINPEAETVFMSSGSESPPFSVSITSQSDCNSDYFRSGSYEGSSDGGNSAGISGENDSGYSRSQGKSQSACRTFANVYGTSSEE